MHIHQRVSFSLMKTHYLGSSRRKAVWIGEAWNTIYIYIDRYICMYAAAAAAKSLKSCLTLCDPIDGSPTGSPVPGILQARILEWVAISFSNAWKWKVKVKSLSRVWLLATPWTAAYQAPLSMGFSRQEYWSRVPLPSPICMYIYIHMYMYKCAAQNWSYYTMCHLIRIK